jgi:tetratricopeptide (TPR) repeat protein
VIGIIASIIAGLLFLPPSPPDFTEEVAKNLTYLSERAEYYIEIGSFTPAIFECEKAIKLYNDSSDNIDKIKLKSVYSKIYKLLGIAFWELAMCQDKELNIEKSIMALKEANKIADNQSTDIYGNLGSAYIELSKVKNRKINLGVSLQFFNSSIEIEKNNESLDYARLLNDRGTAYRMLSSVELKKRYLDSSLKDYETALKVLETLNQSSHDNNTLFQIGVTKSQIGDTYRLLAEVENQRENLDKSINNNTNALKLFKNFNVNDRNDLALIKRNRGSLYYSLSQVDINLPQKDDYISDLNESINYFNIALSIIDQCEYEKTVTRSDLARSKLLLSEAYPSLLKLKLINESIDIFGENLEIWKRNDYPIQIAETMNYLGYALYSRSIVTGNEKDLNEALKNFKIALENRNMTDLPLDYAETIWNIGKAYEGLAKIDSNKKENLENASDNYKKAINVWLDNDCLLDCAYAENTLGNVYIDLSKVNRNARDENLENAKEAYNRSLSIFNEKDYPEMHKIVEGNMKNSMNPSL